MSTSSTSYRTEVLPTDTITKFVNCLLPIDGELVHQDLYVNSTTGLIISPQELFFDNRILPTRVVDLGGRVLSPGFIDVQLNGACGFDFSVIPQDEREYGVGYNTVNKGLIKTGVTSYLPTLTSQLVDVYQKALPWLAAPPKDLRDPSMGSESLGAHCEGPFLNPEKNGIHTPSVLRKPGSLKTIENLYGSDNLSSAVKMVTLAPELLPQQNAKEILADLKSRGIVVSAGHTTATYDQLVESGINMTTHLFNAMPQPHQRSPGILGAVLADKKMTRYYGIIADGVHVHPANVNLAYKTNGEGCILVTDAMKLVGCADGVYEWTNGERIIKKGNVLILEGTDKIAGSSATLIYCLNNFIQWTSTPLAKALETVTSTPARLLGLEGKKGSLLPGADADFCILDVQADGQIAIDEVWKFGVKVHEEKHRRRTANVVVESKL